MIVGLLPIASKTQKCFILAMVKNSRPRKTQPKEMSHITRQVFCHILITMQTRRQSKRKTIGVAATTLPLSETVDSNSSLSIASTTSGASGGRIPLAIHVQAQLCEDIEANGGIASFIGFSQKLYHLLNKLVEVDTLRKSLYKEPGHPIRRRIQQKVYRWQLFWKDELYEKNVLCKFGVVSASQRAQKKVDTAASS